MRTNLLRRLRALARAAWNSETAFLLGLATFVAASLVWIACQEGSGPWTP